MYKIRLKPEDLAKAREIQAVIESEFHNHYTYPEFHQLVGLNTQTIKAAFRAITGQSVYKYLTHVRIEHAKRLLETTGLSIDTIAGRVGLDRSNLSKQFRKLMGVSPGQWRITIRSN